LFPPIVSVGFPSLLFVMLLLPESEPSPWLNPFRTSPGLVVDVSVQASSAKTYWPPWLPPGRREPTSGRRRCSCPRDTTRPYCRSIRTRRCPAACPGWTAAGGGRNHAGVKDALAGSDGDRAGPSADARSDHDAAIRVDDHRRIRQQHAAVDRQCRRVAQRSHGGPERTAHVRGEAQHAGVDRGLAAVCARSVDDQRAAARLGSGRWSRRWPRKS